MKTIISDSDYTQNQDRSETMGEPTVTYHATPSVTPPAESVEKRQMSFEEAARECNAITVDEFFDKLDSQIREHFRNA